MDVSVSAPTTGRVSGGLSANSTPVTHLYGSGNMVVRAGRDILGGSFYEGSGHASITAGGDIGQNGTVSRFKSSQSWRFPTFRCSPSIPDRSPWWRTDRSRWPASSTPLRCMPSNQVKANPLDPTTAMPLYMDTYGPDSKVTLMARRGDLTITIAPTAISDNNRVRACSARCTRQASRLLP